MPRYVFTLDAPPVPGAAEDLPDDRSAKRRACIIADEINRNARTQSRVLVLDQDGALVAAVSAAEG
jgi:hypothetical protein